MKDVNMHCVHCADRRLDELEAALADLGGVVTVALTMLSLYLLLKSGLFRLEVLHG